MGLYTVFVGGEPAVFRAAILGGLALFAADDDYQARLDIAVLEALAGRNLLKMDRDGWLEVAADGEQLWAEVELK